MARAYEAIEAATTIVSSDSNVDVDLTRKEDSRLTSNYSKTGTTTETGAASDSLNGILPRIFFADNQEKTNSSQKSERVDDSDYIKSVRESADGTERYVTFADGSVCTYTRGVLTERTNVDGSKDYYRWSNAVLVQMDRADGKVLKFEGSGYVLYDRDGKSLGGSEFVVRTKDGDYSVKNRPVSASELGDPSLSRKAGPILEEQVDRVELAGGEAGQPESQSSEQSSENETHDDEVISIDTTEPSKQNSFELLKALIAKDSNKANALLQEFRSQGMDNQSIAGAYLSYTGRSLNEDMKKYLDGSFEEPSQEAIEDSQDPFTTVFNKIDTDKNGTISEEESIAAIQNDSFNGEDSRFVAGLRASRMSNSGVLTAPSMSKEDLENYKLGKSANSIKDSFDAVDTNKDGELQKQEIIDFASQRNDAGDGRNDMLLLDLLKGNKTGLTRNDLDVLIANGKNPMADAGNWNNEAPGETSLYGNFSKPADAIRPENFGQGSVGDCHLMSTLSSMSSTEEGRRQIQNMIRDNGDGTYTVTFPGLPNESFTVKKPTEAEQNLYARTRVQGSGYWASVIEKAYGEYVNSSVTRRTIIMPLGADQSNEAAGTGAASIIGGDARTLNLLTGKESDNTSMSSLSDTQLETLITKSKNAGTPMIMGRSPYLSEIITGPDANEAPPGRHYYAIVDYDPNTKMVTVMNPWNRGDSKFSGKFQMPLEQLKKEFSYIAYNK